MNKILLFCGSNRDGYSYKILKEINNRIDSKLIKLRDYHIEFCRGCLYCNDHPKCVINDDLSILIDEIMNHDIIVFAIPNYFGNMGGFYKNFMDRLHYMYSRSILKDKKFIYIYTGGMEDVNETMEELTNATRLLEKYQKMNVINRYSFSSSLELDMNKINNIVEFLNENR